MLQSPRFHATAIVLWFRCLAMVPAHLGGTVESRVMTKAPTQSDSAASELSKDEQSAEAPVSHKVSRFGAGVRWLIAALACTWISWCTAIGPLMRADIGLVAFRWGNAVRFVITFAITFGIVWALVSYGKHKMHRRAYTRLTTNSSPSSLHSWLSRFRLTSVGQRLARISSAIGRVAVRCTDRWWKIFLIFIVGWLWVPLTLLSAYGADVNSQAREFSWAWNQWTGLQQPYIGFFSFVPMDIYPTAHYLWPHNPVYLTDQHNIVLTVLYGAATAISRYFTGSNDAGLVTLSALQWLFAAFVCSATANRFFNLPWLHDTSRTHDFSHPERPQMMKPLDFLRPSRGMGAPGARLVSRGTSRFWIVIFYLCCPLVLFSTISLTKSPLFAFAFVWWFGCLYELFMTYRKTGAVHTRPKTVAALVLSSVVMLISAKYGWYIIVIQVVCSLIADRKRWKIYVLALLLPVILIHGGTQYLVNSGKIIGGDPIESRGVQIQMIARVAKMDPTSIPQSAREKLAPIFNLDQMAAAYNRQDADPVKSSGIQSKKVSYKWRTVTQADMKQFNAAWLEIVKANPRIAMDAFFAECYGYFDVFDPPYVTMSYYINNGYVQDSSTWIKDWNHNWRDHVVHIANTWSKIPVLGWLVHGNTYVVATLLIGAAELVLRRWRALSWHLPLLVLMGVMVLAPANNFARHMLPLVFCLGFLILEFWRDSRRPAKAV